MAGTYSPYVKLWFPDNTGAPAAGYKLFTYIAGTTTKLDTYQDIDLTTPNSNPIVLDSAGHCIIVLAPGQNAKYVLANPTDSDPPTSPLWSIDDISPVPTTGTNIDIDGVAGETLTANDAVYLESGALGTAGRWYQCSDFTLAESSHAAKVGIVLQGATAGEAITVRTAGRVTVAGPLTPGATYYLSNTAGHLETPAPSPETDFEMPYAFGFADTATSLVFPLSAPVLWSKDALRTVAFGSGQSNAAGGADSELTNYHVFVAANYCGVAGNAVVVEGNMTVAANGDAKTVKVRVGVGSVVMLWASSANVASHVVPFRVVLRRRTSTTGSVTSIFWHGVASGNNANPYMVYTTLGSIDWTTNQVITFYCAANTITSVTFNDLTAYGVRSVNGSVV